MSKSWGIGLAAVLACLLLSPQADAEVRKGEILFGPYGVYSVPLDDYPSPRLDDVPYSDFGSDIEPSPGLSGAAERIMSEHLAVGCEFKFTFGSVDEEVLQDLVSYHVPALDEVEVTWRTVHLGARLRYYFVPEKPVNPFLQAGAGLYINKMRAEFRQRRGSGSANEYFRSESTTDPGVSFGPGALIRISKDTRLSVDATVTNVFTSDRNVRYFGLSLGLIFSVTPD